MPGKRTAAILFANFVLFLFIWTILALAGNFFYSAASVLLEAPKTGSVDLDFAQALIFIDNLRPWYAVAGVIALGLTLKMAVKSFISFRRLAKEQKGSRRWTTPVELKNQYRSVPESQRKYRGKGGFPISRYKKRIFIDDSPVNNLIIGTTRSGKGEVYIVPAIDIYSRAKGLCQPSLVVTDPKGELAAASRGILIERGYDVHILDLLTFQGLSYNPLELIKETYLQGNIAEAQTLTATLSHILFNDPLAHDKTWNNWSIALTNALILAVVIDCSAAAQNAPEEEKEEILKKVNLYSVVRLLTDLGAGDGSGDSETKLPIDIFFDTRDESDIARMQYAAVNYASSKTKGNIFANTLAVLTKFTMENIAKMTAVNSLDFKDIGFNKEKPTAVFLVTPDYDSSQNFLVTMFIAQAYFVLAKNASLVSGGKCPREVVFLLDEFGNIPPIPSMESIITVCLGRNIKFTMVVQAYSQIKGKYGDKAALTIIGNCGNQIYLLTIENETATYFSHLVGDETISITSRTGSAFSLEKSLSEHVDRKPLLNPNELMELTPGEAVIVRVTKRTDKRGKSVKPRPIYNREKSRMKYRYEYLGGAFDTKNAFTDIFTDYPCMHRVLNLQELCFSSSLAPLPIPAGTGANPSDLSDLKGAETAKINEATTPNERTFFSYLSNPNLGLIRQCLPGLPLEQLNTLTISDLVIYIEERGADGTLNKGKYAELKRLCAQLFARIQESSAGKEQL